MTPHQRQENNGASGLTWQSPADVSRTHNVLWNGASRLIQVGFQFLFVPVYIYILGPASYGLVVLSATLMAAFAFLDHITNSTVSRAFGMHNGQPERASDLWIMIRTLERWSLIIALLIAMCVPLLGYSFTRHWAKTDGLDEKTMWLALVLMGGALASQFIGTLYAAGLMGLQRQKILSVIRVIWTPVYYGGGAAVLFIIERSVVVLFVWQALAFLVLAGSTRWVLGKTMPVVSHESTSDFDVMHEIRRFGTGSLVMALSGAAVSQIDKFMVAAVSQPVAFAAYGLALSIAMQAMTLASGPFATAMYPHFAQLLAEKNETVLRESYHRWTQIVVLVSILNAGVLLWLGPLLIDLWLGANSPLAPDIKRLLPLVLSAWIVNGAITTPVMLIMAAGRLELIYWINLAAIALAFLFLPVALTRYGMEAGVVFWLAVNLAYCLIMVPLMHRTLLRGEFSQWLLRGVVIPVGASAVLFYGAAQLLPASGNVVAVLLHAGLSMGICCAILLAVLPEGRRQLLASFRFLRA
ncbi:MAG: lipopolysaccharide biosynthesis protein [Beijerinckiaceae bacterium]